MNGGTGLESGAVRAPEPADAAAIAAIHEEGLASGHASLRETAYRWREWSAAHGGCALVAQMSGTLVGWAGVAQASSRPVHSGVGEVSIYAASGSSAGAMTSRSPNRP